jgi:hypothetical protein
MSTTKDIKGFIKQANADDVNKPWIRISKEKRGNDFLNKDFICVEANGKRIYCQLRGTKNESSTKIEISEHYRELLGWEDTPENEVTLKINKINRYFGIWKVIYYHPDDFVRVGIGLGSASIFLGLLSVLISILSSINPSNLIIAIVAGLVIVFIIGFLISMTVSYVIPLKRN